jgi:hypothetical protein
MSQQLLTEPSEKMAQQGTYHKPRPISAPWSPKAPGSSFLQLQRLLGNRQVRDLIQGERLSAQGKIIGIQPKLTVGAANDQYEQEADKVARQVMTMPDSAVSSQSGISTEEDKDKVLQTKPLAGSITPFVQREPENRVRPEDKEEELPVQTKADRQSMERLQRQSEMEEEEQKPIQSKRLQTRAESPTDSFDAGEEVEARLNSSKGGGGPLPDHVRGFMEPRFGVDFSHVRVHTNSEALKMNQDVGAKAFTHGSDIYYGSGQTPGNLELTAHELTHVVQQTGSTPLRTKRTLSSASTDGDSSLQRSCSACSATNRGKGFSGLDSSEEGGTHVV